VRREVRGGEEEYCALNWYQEAILAAVALHMWTTIEAMRCQSAGRTRKPLKKAMLRS